MSAGCKHTSTPPGPLALPRAYDADTPADPRPLYLANRPHHTGQTLDVLDKFTGDITPLVEDNRIRKLSFTGSAEVGWKLKARAGKKRITLELGGNAACILDDTLTDADLDDAADRAVFGAFYRSGQSCISVQVCTSTQRFTRPSETSSWRRRRR